ncbi:MAG: vWA domain-containing protein [Candidatus Sericytochromatia bacterium]
MATPRIELVPLRAAVSTEKATTLDVLVRILPPQVPQKADRPPLNLSLVIDRSGSMQGDKIAYARQAAAFAVEQLTPQDRVSLVAFDDEVNVLVPSTRVEYKALLLGAIRGIEPGGSTALHEAWRQGGLQVSHHLAADHLNRVIVLSDGLANVGETNPDTIAADVHKLAKLGVSTTTLGVGDDYNEDLMQAMAKSGDGNYYYIQSPDQLAAIFGAELQGLMGMAGHTVSLGLAAQNGVVVQDVLNDLDKTATGRYKLPNMVMGNPIEVVIRLKVPAVHAETELLTVRLAWNHPDAAERQVLHASLRLPAVSEAQLVEFPLNEDVQRQATLLMTARAREEAVRHLDAGNKEAARDTLRKAMAPVAAAAPSPMMAMEMQALASLDEEIASGSAARARKQATYESYNRKSSKPNR